MQVDHFNPKLKNAARHRYKNLMLACVRCNLEKSDLWPTRAEIRNGLRFLNCTEEQDYGVHIFEDRSTGRLYGKTPAGTFHIDVSDLNSPYFQRRRRERSDLSLLMATGAMFRDASFATMQTQIATFTRMFANEIPEFPAWIGPF